MTNSILEAFIEENSFTTFDFGGFNEVMPIEDVRELISKLNIAKKGEVVVPVADLEAGLTCIKQCLRNYDRAENSEMNKSIIRSYTKHKESIEKLIAAQGE